MGPTSPNDNDHITIKKLLEIGLPNCYIQAVIPATTQKD